MTALPTQNGLYLDVEGDVWRYDSFGWRLVAMPSSCDDPEDYGPMTRLVPEHR